MHVPAPVQYSTIVRMTYATDLAVNHTVRILRTSTWRHIIWRTKYQYSVRWYNHNFPWEGIDKSKFVSWRLFTGTHTWDGSTIENHSATLSFRSVRTIIQVGIILCGTKRMFEVCTIRTATMKTLWRSTSYPPPWRTFGQRGDVTLTTQPQKKDATDLVKKPVNYQ